MATQTRQKLVDSGLKRFYADGFRSTGLDQILKDVGITKTAFYKHFESKEDLMIEVLEQRAQWMQTRFVVLLREMGGPLPRGQLASIMRAVENLIENGDNDFRGCIFINASMEFPLPHEPAHQAALSNQDALQKHLQDLAESAGAPDPKSLAEELVLAVDGAYVTRQITGDRNSFRIAERVLDTILKSHLGPVRKKRNRQGRSLAE